MERSLQERINALIWAIGQWRPGGHDGDNEPPLKRRRVPELVLSSEEEQEAPRLKRRRRKGPLRKALDAPPRR